MLHIGVLVVDVVLNVDVKTPFLVLLALDAVHFETLADHRGVLWLCIVDYVVLRWALVVRDCHVLVPGIALVSCVMLRTRVLCSYEPLTHAWLASVRPLGLVAFQVSLQRVEFWDLLDLALRSEHLAVAVHLQNVVELREGLAEIALLLVLLRLALHGFLIDHLVQSHLH